MLGIYTDIHTYTCHKKFRGHEFEEEDRGGDMKTAGGENEK